MPPGFFDPAVMMRVVSDTRLSSDARAIVLYVYGLGSGTHEIGFPALRRLLNQAGEKRVRGAVSDAEEVGWLSVVRGGNRGQYPRFTFHVTPDPANTAASEPDPAETAASARAADPAVAAGSANAETAEVAASANDEHADPAETAGSGAASHGDVQGDQETDSSSSPPPSGRALAREELEILRSDLSLDRLRQGLGSRQGAVDALATVQLQVAPGTSFGWAAYVLTAYVEGEDLPLMAGVPPPERPQKVALALRRFAADGKPYDNRLFREYLKTVIRENETDDGNDGPSPTARKPRRAYPGRSPAEVAGTPSQTGRRVNSFGA